ncbi:MAG: hypothetical protein K2X39_05035, partial [Silvanigrellaceae bacterium]|nr:hypothetical protein [Silvanigrellaceae bacterium]
MTDLNQATNFILQVTEQKYEFFCLSLKDKNLNPIDLHFFKEEKNCSLINKLCLEIYSEEIHTIRSLLDKKDVGIAALDVPQSNLFSKKENAVFGAAIVMGIFNNIGNSVIDPIDKTPFTLYSASHSNAELLDSRGMEDFALETKLGFHNDGLLSDEKIEIPT